MQSSQIAQESAEEKHRKRSYPRQDFAGDRVAGNFLPRRGCQILENARRRVWPSICISRRVPALAASSSIVVPPLPLLAPGTTRRPTAAATQRAAVATSAVAPIHVGEPVRVAEPINAGEPDKDSSPFTKLLAALFAPTAVGEADEGAAPNGALPSSIDKPADLGTLLKGLQPVQHTTVSPSFAGDVTRPVGHASPHRLADRQPSPKVQSADPPLPTSDVAPLPGRQLRVPQEMPVSGQFPVSLQPAEMIPARTPIDVELPLPGLPVPQRNEIPAPTMNTRAQEPVPQAAPLLRSGTAVKTSPKAPSRVSSVPEKPQPAHVEFVLPQTQPSAPPAAALPSVEIPTADTAPAEASDHDARPHAAAHVPEPGGQPPRTLATNPTALPPPPPAPTVLRNPPPAAAETHADTQVRILAASTPDRGEVAFAVQLKPVPPAEGSTLRESSVKSSRSEEPRRSSIPAAPPEAPLSETETATERRQSPSPGPELTPPHAARERRPEESPSDRIEAPSMAPAGKLVPHTPEAQMKAAATPEPATAEPAKPPRPQEATRAETAPEAAKGSPVRDMKLELTGGEQRVEVRLSERGGEVKMTVRTPDAHLATVLRENLPALSARLAESGYKSEAWHPAASSISERTHTADPSANSAFQDANPSPRQQDRQPQEQGGQRQRKNPEEPAPQQQKGRDFAWLMSSLR